MKGEGQEPFANTNQSCPNGGFLKGNFQATA
jgi:hypothetical protein